MPAPLAPSLTSAVCRLWPLPVPAPLAPASVGSAGSPGSTASAGSTTFAGSAGSAGSTASAGAAGSAASLPVPAPLVIPFVPLAPLNLAAAAGSTGCSCSARDAVTPAIWASPQKNHRI